MADGIDPNIALSYRPPNLATMPNLQIQSPLEGLARVVSLRNLMQEGTLRGLQIDQARQALQGAKNIAAMFANYANQDPNAGGAVDPVTGLPVTPTTAPVTAAPSYAIPPPAPMAGGAPVTPQGVDVTAGLDKYLTAPAAAPAADTGAGVTPAPAPTAAPAAFAPGLFAPAPERRMPTQADFLKADPYGGQAAWEQFSKGQKEMFDLADKKLTYHSTQNKTMADILASVTDDESFKRQLPEIVRVGGLSGAQADALSKLGWDNPSVQKWAQERQIQSMGAYQAAQLALARSKDLREQGLYPAQLSKAENDAKQADWQSAGMSVDKVQSDKDWPAWFKDQGPYSQAAYASIITNPSLSFQQKKQLILMGAGGAAEVAKAGATTTATEQAKNAEWVRQHEPEIQDIMAGNRSLQDVPPEDLSRYQAEIARREAAARTQTPPQPVAPAPAQAADTGAPQAPAQAPGAPSAGGGTPQAPTTPPQVPAPAPKIQFGKRPSDEEVKRLSDLQRAWTIANELQKKIREPQSIDLMGPVAGLRSLSPYASATNSLKDYLGSAQQALKKFQTQGSLRGFTEKQLDEMSPNIYTHPDEANQQVVNMKNTITAEYEQLVKDLQGAGKVVPEALIPKTASPAPATAPSKQPQAAPTQIPADVQKLVGPRKGKYTFPDGRVFYRKADGSIVAGQ